MTRSDAAAVAGPVRIWRSLRGVFSPPLVVEPFLHLEPARVYNPLTCRELLADDPLHETVRALAGGRGDVAGLDRLARRRLAADGWLVADRGDLDRRYRLRGVGIETHTVCNHRCYFCPVSVAPRDSYFMPDELFERIVGQVVAHRDTVEGVFLNNYNEPTLDRRFVDQCRALMRAGLPVAVNTNATGLTPERVDAILAEGPLRFLSINLSTIDRERYRRDRGKDQLELVLRHVDYVATLPAADEMVVVVLGTGDDRHRADYEEIGGRFAGSRFAVRYEVVMNRAGHLEVGRGVGDPARTLAGCENIGSRPIQHLHVNPYGQCVLCCQDYDERYLIGDLGTSTIDEVMSGDAIARYRRWAYGLDDAPDDFICRHCVFALSCPAR